MSSDLKAKAFRIVPGMNYFTGTVVPLSDALEAVASVTAERDALESKLVDLALELAAHVTSEDRKRILASEDVRSIMNLRLR